MSTQSPWEQFKSWLPVIITFVTVLGWFFTQSARIQALEVRADGVDETVDSIGIKVDKLVTETATIKVDIKYIREGIDDLKRR